MVSKIPVSAPSDRLAITAESSRRGSPQGGSLHRLSWKKTRAADRAGAQPTGAPAVQPDIVGSRPQPPDARADGRRGVPKDELKVQGGRRGMLTRRVGLPTC
jgi:hypothetical protein